jgi:hypothetical protein
LRLARCALLRQSAEQKRCRIPVRCVGSNGPPHCYARCRFPPVGGRWSDARRLRGVGVPASLQLLKSTSAKMVQQGITRHMHSVEEDRRLTGRHSSHGRLRTYLHLREWGELRHLLDLPAMMLVWVGMIVLGLVMLVWPRR